MLNLTKLEGVTDYKEAWNKVYPHNLIECASVCVPATITEDSKGRRVITPEVDPDGRVSQFLHDPSRKYIMRDDGTVIGHVGAGYELIQPVDAMAFFEPFLASGRVVLDSGGALAKGAKMFGLGRIVGAEGEVVRGDPVQQFLLAATAFDGSMSHVIKNTSIRPVCENTLAMAIAQTDRWLGFYGRHTRSLPDRIATVQVQLDRVLDGFKANLEILQALGRKQMTRQQMVAYIRRVIIPADQLAEVAAGKTELSGKMQAKLTSVIDLLENQRGLELVPAARGTAWQAYNAVTNYLTHEAGRNQDNRLNSLWFGDGGRTNQKALELALSA